MYPSRILVALDGMDSSKALRLAENLAQHVAGFKVNDLLDEMGISICKRLASFGEVMADPKLSDIPNTMRNRARRYQDCTYLTVHTSNTSEALIAARNAIPDTCILGVTVLTSISDDDKNIEDQCEHIYGLETHLIVEKFASKAAHCNLGGIVCSAKELELLKNMYWAKRLKFVIPGVRSVGANTHDQKRVMTPAEAVQLGAHRVVIGREITDSASPVDAAKRINDNCAR